MLTHSITKAQSSSDSGAKEGREVTQIPLYHVISGAVYDAVQSSLMLH